MRTHKALAAGAALLALALVFLAVGRADDEKNLAPDLNKLVKTAADKPGEVQKAGAAFAKAHKIDNDSIKDVMDYLGKRDTKDPKSVAWGVGKTPGAISPDGIELKLRALAKKALKPDQLKAEKGALAEIGQRTAAVGSVALASPPKKDLPGKKVSEWKKWSEDMVKASRDFEKTVKTGKPTEIKQAASKLNGSCVDCHAAFRD